MNEMMLETKAYGLEPRQALDDLQSAFAAYRDANDTRLADLETRGSADVVTLDKLNRLDAALDKTQRRLDELTLKARRPELSGDTSRHGAGLEPVGPLKGFKT